MPPIILSGCNFTGCSVAFSGPASNVNNAAVNNAAIVEDVLKGIGDVLDNQLFFIHYIVMIVGHYLKVDIQIVYPCCIVGFLL